MKEVTSSSYLQAHFKIGKKSFKHKAMENFILHLLYVLWKCSVQTQITNENLDLTCPDKFSESLMNLHNISKLGTLDINSFK